MTEPAWSPAELVQAAELWHAYATQDQVAEVMHKTVGSVAFHLTKLGLRGRKRRPDEPAAMGRVWTGDEIGDLRRFWAQQKTKFQIAEIMGRAPGAVLNKASEIGLTGAKKLTTALPPVDVPPMPVRRELPLVPPSRTCTWLDGDPKERNFCGADSVPGLSYCPDHRAIVFVPWAPREVKVSF